MVSLDLKNILPNEIVNYSNKLIPNLLKYRPFEWVAITIIADDVDRFISIVECLAAYGTFNNYLGWGIIEIKEDKFVRVDPFTLLYPNKLAYQWNNKLKTKTNGSTI